MLRSLTRDYEIGSKRGSHSTFGRLTCNIREQALRRDNASRDDRGFHSKTMVVHPGGLIEVRRPNVSKRTKLPQPASAEYSYTRADSDPLSFLTNPDCDLPSGRARLFSEILPVAQPNSWLYLGYCDRRLAALDQRVLSDLEDLVLKVLLSLFCAFINHSAIYLHVTLIGSI